MIDFFELVCSEFIRRIILLRRYPINFFMSVVLSFIVLSGIVSGASYLTNDELSEVRTASMTLSYFIWVFCLGIMTTGAEDICEDAKLGCLENIVISRHGLYSVLLARKLVGSFFSFLNIAPSFLLMVYLFDLGFYFYFSGLILFSFVVVTSFGVSYLLGSLALFNKQMQAASALLQLVFVWIFVFPFEDYSGNCLLGILVPYISAMASLRDVFVEDNAVSFGCFFSSAVNSVVVFCLGSYIFNLSVKKSKERSVLGEV